MRWCMTDRTQRCVHNGWTLNVSNFCKSQRVLASNTYYRSGMVNWRQEDWTFPKWFCCLARLGVSCLLLVCSVSKIASKQTSHPTFSAPDWCPTFSSPSRFIRLISFFHHRIWYGLKPSRQSNETMAVWNPKEPHEFIGNGSTSESRLQHLTGHPLRVGHAGCSLSCLGKCLRIGMHFCVMGDGGPAIKKTWGNDRILKGMGFLGGSNVWDTWDTWDTSIRRVAISGCLQFSKHVPHVKKKQLWRRVYIYLQSSLE